MRGNSGERVRFEILGPMRVTDGRGTRPVAGGRQRIVLGALLEHANRPMSAERLAEVVWDGAPPDGAVPTLRTYVMRLRRGLGPTAAERIVTGDNGYLARVEEHELDALCFQASYRTAEAAAHAGDWPAVAEAAERALSQWRGTPLLDVPCRTLHEAWLPRLEQSWLQAREWQAEAALHLGRNEQLIQPLRELTAAHPLRERFHAQLMLALYRTGRQAEALAAYQDARRALVEALGIEPGAELRALHERILAGDGDPSVPGVPERSETVPRPSEAAAPRQLPAATGHFAGRQDELDRLARLVESPRRAEGPGGTVVVSAIDGMAGIGKTALAVHVAHRVSSRFPDGQLFVDLHGYTRGHPPREPGDALSMLLRALEVPAQRIPEDTEERAALYRQRLAGTRTLILLDNARDEAQVRHLLPGTPGCLVLVTSRRRLKGLHDAHVLALDALPEPDALALLRTMLEPARSSADDAALREIVGLCERLPLALRIAGALLRHRPDWMPQHLAALLRDHQWRLTPLSDGEHDLHAVFDLSYTALDEQHRLLLRRLALAPGPDIAAYAAAALLDLDVLTATGMLEDLVDHNLLLAHAPGRYRLHDLIRAHARTLAERDPADERAATLDRLLNYYAHTAHAASIPLARYPRPAPDGPAPARVPALPGPEAGRAWLRAERENLEAAHARASSLDEDAAALAIGLAEILRSDGPLGQARDMLQDAADTARRHGRHAACATALTDLGIVRRLSGDLLGAGEALAQSMEMCGRIGLRSGEAGALSELGMVKLLTGDAAGAGAAHSRAVTIFQEVGHRRGEATALIHLGVARRLAGKLSGSGDALSRALELCRQIGHRSGEASALAELGAARRMAGDLTAAADAHLQALKICREIGHRDGQATVLSELGIVRRLAGDLPGADEVLTQAVEIYRQFGHRTGEAHALAELGRVRHIAGDTPAAAEALHRALETFRATGNRNNEAWALNHYAAVITATGDLPHALTLYRQALAMNRELNKLDDEAVSLEGLAECHLSAGRTETGTIHLGDALTIYRRLGMASDAARVRTKLAGLTVVRSHEP
jgi:DNA-binding SARP family transcriptional activator